MAAKVVVDELHLPPKYTKPSSRDDRIEALVNRLWLRQLVKNRRIPDFIFHDKFSDDEVSALFKQGEQFSSSWQHITITVIKKQDKLVIPLPRIRFGSKPDSKLSISQIMHYVSHTNMKNLWKEAYKKYTYGFPSKEPKEAGSVQLTEHTTLLRDVISRMYGIAVIKIGGKHMNHDTSFQLHPNVLMATAALESNQHFLIIQETNAEHTMQDCVTFSPAVLSSSHYKPLFIIYQLLRLMRHLHDMGLVLGEITLQDIKVADDLWIQVIPRISDNVYDTPLGCQDTPVEEKYSSKLDGCNGQDNPCLEIGYLTEAWVVGCISNYDYLCALNRLAGRRLSDPRRHYVLPWVSDLTSRSGSNWRDFTKSKFRLNKGDRQLDLTYQLPPALNSAQVPHHVPDVLSEITYYVYLSRVTPKSILCKYVRTQWVPAEYPASIQRLQEWSPDECIPEFFTDSSVFKSIHSDLGDLEVPSWASTPQDFITQHRAALESDHVSTRLHHWIDLTFGYKLSGSAAVKSKNVCLQLIDGHTNMTGSGVVQLFTLPHPHRMAQSPYWGRTPPRLHSHELKKMYNEDEDGHSSGLEDDEPVRTSSVSLSRFMSRSRTSLITSPISSSTIGGSGDIGDNNGIVGSISLPRDYSPTVALSGVEALHGFTFNALHTPGTPLRTRPYTLLYKQLVAARRAREMQVLGCLIVEMMMAAKMRVFRSSSEPVEFSRRLWICRNIIEQEPDHLPRCLRHLVNLLLQVNGGDEEVTALGIPPPSAHQLLQPLLTSTLVPFPGLFPTLYSTVVVIQGFSRALNDLQSSVDSSSDMPEKMASLSRKISECKVKSIVSNVELIVDDDGPCLHLLLSYVLQLLYSPDTDVIAAWYLFDHIARGLGHRETSLHFLDSIVRLYDWDRPKDPKMLRKRVKLYHRSFLLRLIVRFGLSVFLESFVPPLVEAVGGYHDLDQNSLTSHLDEVEEGLEVDNITLLSPLDEDSSADSDRLHSLATDKGAENNDIEPEVFMLEEDISEEGTKQGPQSAISLQNLLIDNIETQPTEEKEGEDVAAIKVPEFSDGSWRRKSYSNDRNYVPSEIEYSKVCEVAGDSVLWLAARLGPVLTARHLTRNLLRMLALCYAGPDNLRPVISYRLVGDDNAQSVLHCLSSITDLYGEQLIVVQYLPHMAELISLCKRKLTVNLEGGLIGCLVLLGHILANIADTTFVDVLQDVIVRSIVGPALRILASCSTPLPSGVAARRALASKLFGALVALIRRAASQQRIALLQTVQRFFLAFSKAHGHTPDPKGSDDGGSLNTKGRVKKEMSESPPLSVSCSDLEQQRSQATEELKETLNCEFAYIAFVPLANFFGESVMEQSLRNYDLVKVLCEEYTSQRQADGHQIPGTCDFEPPEIVEPSPETPLRVGSFSNVVVVGNRIDLQESAAKTNSPTNYEEVCPSMNKKVENNSRHLRGNWLAYWEHEIGRSSKDSRLNVKQIKLQSFTGHCGSVRHLVPLASENSFMSASRDKTVRLWSLRSQGDGSHVSPPQWTYTGHRKSVVALGFVDRLRLTASCDSVVHLWDPFVGRVVSVVEASRAPPVNALRPLNSPSSTVLCATPDSIVRSLDARSCSYVSELKAAINPGGLIRCMVVSPNSNWLAVGHASGLLTILDLRIGRILASWKAHDAEILQLVAVDDLTLISSSLDQAVSVWSATDGKLKFVLKGPTEPVHCLEVYCNEVLSGTTANRIGVHTSVTADASFSSTRLRSDTLKGVLTSMAILPLNRLILLGADSGNVALIC